MNTLHSRRTRPQYEGDWRSRAGRIACSISDTTQVLKRVGFDLNTVEANRVALKPSGSFMAIVRD